MIKIQTATLIDLDHILAIQDLCYYAIEPESKLSMASKIVVSPDTCFVAKEYGQIMGYLLSIPALLGEPPALDSETKSVIENPECLYLHDLAVHPDIRGKGVGVLLLNQFMDIAREKGFQYSSLISIQNSVSFWEKQGFYPVNPSENLKHKLCSYGQDAVYMEKKLSYHGQE